MYMIYGLKGERLFELKITHKSGQKDLIWPYTTGDR